MINTYKIQISGRVQGVGFRPFIYNLAKENNLAGFVTNNEEGVLIFINTKPTKAKIFYESILKEKPKVSIIKNSSFEKVIFKEFYDFIIQTTNTNLPIQIPLTPDFAVCKNCKKEVLDSKNRRYKYAFTTCVHCGPRYALTQKYPFERTNTSLSKFEMCIECKEEYTEPSDNRFHSQTNSCPTCGVSLELTNNNGAIIKLKQKEIIPELVSLIKEGNIVAIKNTNGYLLCCDAKNTKTIEALRKRKNRQNKPFAVLYPSIDEIKKEFEITIKEEYALNSNVAPIVIVQNTNKTKIKASDIAPNLNQTGVMLPSSTLLYLIMQEMQSPFIATSGNIHGSPIVSTKENALQELNTIADYFLHHNLEIVFPQDDSVLKFVEEKEIIIRRSRGLAPSFLEEEINSKEIILAMGSHLKSAFTFVPNSNIYVSPYFGNLDNYEVTKRYQKTIEQYQYLFEKKPNVILIDKHLQYQSSIIGKELNEQLKGKLIEIQHHKAHFCSVLAENNLFESKESILGIVWDGTGFGDDKEIWGGEFFIYKNNEIKRQNHFEYFDWFANDKMAKEPRISLFSLTEDIKIIETKFSETEIKIYSKLKKNNKLKTSSVGRLFDAVASLLNIVDVNSYDAEAPMLLENIALECTEEHLIDLLENESYQKIPTKRIIEKLQAIKTGYSKAFLAKSFIFTLAKIIVREAKKNDLKTIACSGGVFQNSLLISFLNLLSKKNKMLLKINRKLSSNDENISFGQLMYYKNIKN